jgi:hypothetical protein
MQTAIYQLSLVLGLGTLAVLLIRGYSLMTALQRSGLVLVVVLIILLFAGNIIRWGITPNPADLPKRPPVEDDADEADEPEAIPGGPEEIESGGD